MKKNSSHDEEIMKQPSDEDAKSPANDKDGNNQANTGKYQLVKKEDQQGNTKIKASSPYQNTPINNVALQESFQGNNIHQNSIHIAGLEEQFTLAKINRMSMEETNSPWRTQNQQDNKQSHDEEQQVLGMNYLQKISSLKTMAVIQGNNNLSNPQQLVDFQNLNGAFEQSTNNKYTTDLNQNSQIQNKHMITNSISADFYQRSLINSQRNISNKPQCTLWQIIRGSAALIFLIQQTLQWINFVLVLQYNKKFAWILLSFNLISPIVGLIYIIYQIKKYDYFLVLFPRKRVGVFFIILSFFNLDFVYAQLYQAFYIQSSDFIKIFNENNLRKKRLNLIFQNFTSVILTSLVLFERNSSNSNNATDTSWVSQTDFTSGFFFTYIFYQIFDLAFHLTFFSTDFFDDFIALFFNLFDLCCNCFRDDEDDEDDEDEEASQVKYDNDKIDKQSLLFRQIPFTTCSFLKFIRDNIILSLSFYHNFFDLSIRALLFGIAHKQIFYKDYSVLLVYQLEVLLVLAIIALIIVIGIINCCFEVSKTYFEKGMLIIVSCLQGVIIKLSRWNISRIFEGMTQKQLFILKFVPGLIRLCELVVITVVLFFKSEQSFEKYILNFSFISIYIHYIGFSYALFLASELIYELFQLVFVYSKKPDQQYSPSKIQLQKDRSLSNQEDQIENDQHQQQNEDENQIFQNQQQIITVIQNNKNDQMIKYLNNQQPPSLQKQISHNSSINKQKSKINQIRKESSESDAIQSFNDEPNPKQVYQTFNHLSRFQYQLEQNTKSDGLSFNSPANQIFSCHSMAQQSSNRCIDTKSKLSESKKIKTLHSDNFSINKHRARLYSTEKPVINGDTESQSNFRHQDSEKQNNNFEQQQVYQLNASSNSFNQNQEAIDLTAQKNYTISKGSQDSLNYTKENGHQNQIFTNFHQPKSRAKNIMAQRALQSERRYNEEGGDSIISAQNKFTQIQVETTNRTNLNKIKTATELKRNSKENLTPLKSPSESYKGELLSFQGSPTKLTSIPSRKVTDVINKYSNIQSQRRKKSANTGQSFSGQERNDLQKNKRKSNILPKSSLNQLVENLKFNTNNNI